MLGEEQRGEDGAGEAWRRLAYACPADLAGLRDRALLLLAAAGLPEAAILRLDAQHLRPAAGGLLLRLARAGAGADAVGEERRAPPEAAAALEAWCAAAALRFGPVFCKVSHAGTPQRGRRLAAGALRRVLRRRAGR
ncbi:hypothetical protein ACI6QG_14390 [Roseococcus sp. DSY-14]|uniref:hypothetical protein n=1 Tax=Roseococcus sp. DSY-14 TaxID=3369650 RepID=UPI00387AEFB1